MDDVSITIGALLTLCIYHMFVFIGRRKDLSNLAFSLLCFMYIFITIVIRVYPNLDFFDKHLYNILVVLSASLIGICVIFFIHTIFDLKKIKFLLTPYIVILGISSTICFPLYSITRNMVFIYIMVIIMLIHVVPLSILTPLLIILKKQYRDKKKKIFLLGFLVIMVQAIMFLVVRCLFSYDLPSELFKVSILLMAFLFAYALTGSFNREHKDLLELKDNLERKVRERTRQLKQAHRQKTAFFINLAHETKTPVTLISNYLDAYIKKKGISPETRVIKRNIEKLLRDIVNILDMEKLETGITFYNHDQILDLTHIVKQKVMFYKELACKKNIDITVKCNGPIALRMDPYAIDRILNNLIDNALKYNRTGGSVEVRLKSKLLEDKIEISVKDTGIGIDKQKLKHIFDPFYQISRQKKNYQGLGLGLSIVKRITDEIGAELSVRSEKGKGAEFTISLDRYVPVKNERVMKRVTVSKPEDTFTDMGIVGNEYKEGRYDVLVVEDNPEMLAFLCDNIACTYNFYGAQNGKQALDMLASIPKPHLIISDIMMDIMDGYELYENIASHRVYKSIPVIFLTAKTSRYQQLKGLTSGAVDFISKPFSIDVLMAKIKSIIRNQEQQKEAILNQIGIDLYRFLSDKARLVSVYTADKKQTRHHAKEKLEGTLNKLQPFSSGGSWEQEFAGGTVSNVLYRLETEYGISKREMEVIRLIKEGFLYKEIAAELDISPNTVETYRKRIFKKCNVQNKIELFRIFSKQ
jgi:signal transduction histidine kinase/DNA-binding NarL/FixJ family response regulator